jgi:hypothetical protein
MWDDIAAKKGPHEATSTRTDSGIVHQITRQARVPKRTPRSPEEDCRIGLDNAEAPNRPLQTDHL